MPVFFAASFFSLQPPGLLLIAGLVGLFACARVLSASVAPLGTLAPGLRAIGLFLPVAAVALFAQLTGHSEIAIGVVFGTSVGALTTVVGFIALAEPIGPGPQRFRRLWPFPLAAALIVFVAGFKGSFSWRDAVALLVQGTVVLALWRDRTPLTPATSPVGPPALPPADPATTTHYAAAAHARHSLDDQMGAGADMDGHEGTNADRDGTAGKSVGWMAAEIAVALPVLGLAAWAAVEGTLKFGAVQRQFSPAGLAASVVSLAMVMPMTYGAWRRAEGGRSWEPMTTQVAVVLLNLCLLLPVLILIPYLAAGPMGPLISKYAGETLAYGPGLVRPLLFPVAFWRVDTVILIIVTVLMLPVSAGKWNLAKEEAMALIAGYFFYLTAILWAAGRL